LDGRYCRGGEQIAWQWAAGHASLHFLRTAAQSHVSELQCLIGIA